MFVQFWALISICYEIYYNCIDPYAAVDAVVVLTCGILAILKITCFRIYSDNLSRNLKSAIDDFVAMDKKAEEKRVVMRRHAFMGRTICYCFISVSYIAVLFYMILPLLVGQRSVEINGSVVIPSTIYPIPSTCTLGSLSISTSIHIVLFLWQGFILLSISTGNLGNVPIFSTL